ncbi:shikimate dehydrogenase [candidate division KSB1 bacterium]
MISKNFSGFLRLLEKGVSTGKQVYGVFGNPVSHSLSPFMHNEAFRMKNMNALYLPFEVPVNELQQCLKMVSEAGISGLNITIPLKEAVVQHLDDLSPEVKKTGSANTISFRNGRLKGDNTDIDGFLRPLKQYAEPIKYESAVVFGSGGSARAVLFALLRNYNFPYIYLIARDREKADKLLDEAELWKKGQTFLEYRDFKKSTAAADAIWESRLLVNCTPLGMKSVKTPFPSDITRFFRPGQIFYDLIYNPLRTPILIEGERHGGLTISGLSMFVEQGAKSFRIWTGKVMPRKKIYEILKDRLAE